MFKQILNSPWRWALLIVFSLVLHVVWFIDYSVGTAQEFLNRKPVSIKIVAAERPKPSQPVASKPKPKPKPRVTKQATKPTPTPREQTAGTANSSTNDKQDPTDETPRTAALGPPSLSLAADAQLVRSSYRAPAYTRAAAAAGYVDEVIARILVDAQGNVDEVKLAKPLKFGMDRPLIQSIFRARFTPATNSQGEPVRGWTEIRFRLVIPD